MVEPGGGQAFGCHAEKPWSDGAQGTGHTEKSCHCSLRSIDPSPAEIDRHEADRFRIANEVILQLEMSSVVAPNNPGGGAMQAFRERGSKEQVKRTRAELEAYLDQRREGEERGAHHRQEAGRPRGLLFRNPILAALAKSES